MWYNIFYSVKIIVAFKTKISLHKVVVMKMSKIPKNIKIFDFFTFRVLQKVTKFNII